MSFYLLVIQVDQSWANSTVLDVLNFVPDYEECQTLCRVRMNNDLCKIHPKWNIQDKAGCKGWTWISETNADHPNYCLMFSSLGDLENFPGCVREEPINLFYSSQNLSLHCLYYPVGLWIVCAASCSLVKITETMRWMFFRTFFR